MSRTEGAPIHTSVWFRAIGAFCVIAVLYWCLRPSKVDLNPDTYEIAIALYRVCNQQDGDGLQAIQVRLSELSTTAENDSSIAHLQGIVDKADAGEWATAMQRTRQTLDDQVSGL